MKVVERELTVKIDPGLQARPAAKFVQEANRFSAEIFWRKAESRSMPKV